MTTRLAIYNEALRLVQERTLNTLTDDMKSRRLLDGVWDNGGIRDCLEQGLWNCAMRTVKIEYDPSIEPDFGYRRAFAKPTDWIRTAALSSDEYFTAPFDRYEDEAGYWFADIDILYVRFVSDDASYGGDLTKWPQSLFKAAAAHFAAEVAPSLTGGRSLVDDIEKKRDKRFAEARAKDAMNEPIRYIPRGSWSQAVMGGRRTYRER